MVLDSVDDILVDHPNGIELLSLFMARAAIDDILPRSFASKVPKCATGTNKAAVIDSFNRHIGSRHAAERLLRCWGEAGVGHDIDATKASIRSLLCEYIASSDAEEASRCLHSLKVPFFHHEVVKQIAIMTLEEPAVKGSMGVLLSNFSRSGLIPESQTLAGFSRVSQRLHDLELDIPNVRDKFHKIVEEVVAAGILGTQPSFKEPSTGSTESVDQEGLDVFKKGVSALLSEYFSSGDAVEATRALDDLGQSVHHGWFVKRAVTSAMDRRPREKEMVSLSTVGRLSWSSNRWESSTRTATMRSPTT